MIDWEATARRLLAEKEVLVETVRQLRDILRPTDGFPLAWGLTPAETRILALLARRGEATTRNLLAVATTFENFAPDDDNVVRVHILRLRRKVKPFGVSIATRFGHGYYLDGEAREIVQRAFRAAPDAEKREIN